MKRNVPPAHAHNEAAHEQGMNAVPVKKKLFLMAGQFIITTAGGEISTVLGSCVAVCLWDKRLKFGGMNHYLLPGQEDSKAGDPNRGLSATRMLIRSMINRKANPETMEAKVFGGCNSLYPSGNRFVVGERNIQVALEVLREANIPVVSQNTGGAYGRKILFDTATGHVRVKLLTKTAHEVNDEIQKGFGY
jgi:chemotaxis protein CheD